MPRTLKHCLSMQHDRYFKQPSVTKLLMARVGVLFFQAEDGLRATPVPEVHQTPLPHLPQTLDRQLPQTLDRDRKNIV